MSGPEIDPHGKQEWVIHYQWPTHVPIREGRTISRPCIRS